MGTLMGNLSPWFILQRIASYFLIGILITIKLEIAKLLIHQNNRFVRFCQFLDFQKNTLTGVPSGHIFQKKQFHGDKSVKPMDLSEFFKIILKSELLTSRSWIFTNVHEMSYWGGIIWSTFQKNKFYDPNP